MNCPTCQSEARRFGKDRKGNQRFQCLACKKTFSDIPVNPLGEMRLPLDKAVKCLQLLLEGVSVRATMRITGTNRETILNLMNYVGERCSFLMEGRIKNVPVADVQCDEIWGFVGMKEKTRLQKHPEMKDAGDAYCYLAIERETKLVLAWHLGIRSSYDTQLFADQLARATSGRFQISTDGYKPYQTAIPAAMPQADFAQLVKQYAEKGEGKYSPGEVTGTIKMPRNGHPEESRICTSHVERKNLTIRMSNRRMTRLTNAFSKKWENHAMMLSLQFAYYNFCRKHMTLKTTPAVAAGLEDHAWTIEELIVNSAKTSTH
jgi:transposase-like protein/IS1 family transposase